MSGNLVVTVVREGDDDHGYIAGFAITNQMVVAVGGLSSRAPIVLASSNARRFVDRATPRRRGLRDALAVGDAVWVCGEYGQLAVTRDHGATWSSLDSGTEDCLFALALASDGAVWVVGEDGYAARILGERPEVVSLGTSERLLAVYPVIAAAAAPGEVALLGASGTLRRWRDGKITEIATGVTTPLTSLAITTNGTWVVAGDRGFVARSPNGTWFSRVKLETDADLESMVALPGGHLVVVGERGVILVSPDDGRTWRSVPHPLGRVHLWSVERFGAGVLIGGDGGLVARLAPPGDATWAHRNDVFAAAPDCLFAIAEEAEDDDDEDDDDDADEDVFDDEDDDDDDDDDEDDDDDDVEGDGDEEGGAVFRVRELMAELDHTPRQAWSELAWSWLGDPIAHRVLLDRLAHTHAASQITALAEIAELPEDERAVAIPQLAAELIPELEAILVGSIVRDDMLVGAGPLEAEEADLGAERERRAPGWDAIDRALAPLYGDMEPLHYGTAVSYKLGGNDPLHGISAYARTEPVPHWHFVTYGFTDLFEKETDDPEESGFGFELTFRLARSLDEQHPPAWALDFLQNLARYVFGTGNRFAAGHKMGLNGPIALGQTTAITAVCFADDPELDEIESELGAARFVQIVGITDDEYRLIQEWSTPGLLEMLRERLPHLVTDLARCSVLEDPVTARTIEQRVAQEGSSEDLTFAGEMMLDADDGRVHIELGALYAAVLPRAMRGRIRHGRSYELRGRAAALHLEPARHNGYRHVNGELVLEITQELAGEIEARLHDALVGTYRFELWPALTISVTPSFIRAQDGTATEVRGIADPDQARAMIEAYNARIPDDDDEDMLVEEAKSLRELKFEALDEGAAVVLGERERSLMHVAGEVLAARARAGRLDPRAPGRLCSVLRVPQRYEYRRRAVVGVLAALRDASSVPALIRLIEDTQIETALDAIGQEELLCSAATALGAISDPAAIPALTRLVTRPGAHNDEPRPAAACALAACIAGTPAPRDIDEGVFDALLEAIRERNDSEASAELHFAYGRLAGLLEPARRAVLRERLGATPAVHDDRRSALARQIALVLAGDAPPEGVVEAALRPLVHDALTQLDYDHDYTVRTIRFALRVADTLPELVAAPDLVWLTRFAEPDVRAGAHAVLERLGRPLPEAAVFDRRAARLLDDATLVRAIGEDHVVGRAALVREAGRRALASARRAIIKVTHDVLGTVRPGAYNLMAPESSLLEAAVQVLRAAPLDTDTSTLFDRMLRHPNFHVKWELLQDPPDDDRLIGGMFHVLGERWGWQEKVARQWLARRQGSPEYEAARRRAGAPPLIAADDDDADEDDSLGDDVEIN